MSASPNKLNPILANDSASAEVSGWLFNAMLTYDKDGNIKTDLASSYKFINDTKIIIKLKKNVLWHDKKKFTAHDVVFTYKQIINPKVYTSTKSNFKEVKSLKALDDYTIEVIYKRPYFKALVSLMFNIIPKHILENEKDLMTSSFNKKPIGTGPYKIKEFEIGKDVILYANDDYFDGRPKIDKISYKYLPDPNTTFLFLKQKKLDVAKISAIQVDRQLDEKFKENYSIIETQDFSYLYLGLNLRLEKFKNKKIREALAYAINKQELIDILYFGHGKISNGPFIPGSLAYNKDAKSIKQNIKKSKALLKELGYDEKNPFTFTVTTNTGSNTTINTAEILQYQLAKAGIKMKIKVMEWQAFLNTTVTPRKFEAIILAWNTPLMPDAYPLWHSNSDKIGRFNLVGYHNKKLNNLIEEASITVNKDKFKKMYREIYKIISEDLPYIFLFIPNSITVVNKKIKNVEPSFTGIMHNQKDWIKEEEN